MSKKKKDVVVEFYPRVLRLDRNKSFYEHEGLPEYTNEDVVCVEDLLDWCGLAGYKPSERLIVEMHRHEGGDWLLFSNYEDAFELFHIPTREYVPITRLLGKWLDNVTANVDTHFFDIYFHFL